MVQSVILRGGRLPKGSLCPVGLRVSLLVVGVCLAAGLAAAQRQPETPPAGADPGLWEAGVGEGFRPGAHELDLSAGPGSGMRVFGSQHTHDLGLGVVQYGWMVGKVAGQERWYRGNWELLGEVFGAGQFHPSSGYVIGGAPLLRYNFATGHRWIPFVDLGAGMAATDIRNGDLSTTFEFTLQTAAGLHLFLRDDLALTLQYRFVHLSNASVSSPNLGVNTSAFLTGLTLFF